MSLARTRAELAFSPDELRSAVARFRERAEVVREGAAGAGSGGRIGVAFGALPEGLASLGSLPPLYPEWLGDRSFSEVHGARFPYIAGAMANGICTVAIVEAMARAGMLSFFGAAGLSYARVEEAARTLGARLGGAPGHTPGLCWGMNLIHSPNEPELEAKVADLYLRAGVARVSASAFMALSPSVVRYSAAGLRLDPSGRIRRSTHVFAKISRPEVARHFLAPAPGELLEGLVARGQLTEAEAQLARRVPVAEDIIVESDSGGHTDNRPLGSLFPTIASLRDRIVAEQGYERPIRVGAAGGIGTPASAASAFGLGAAFILTGSINQSAVESGLSADGKAMLAKAGLADVAMAPAADMFELGVEVQVLKRGTLFAPRAHRLYEVYQRYPSIDAIPKEEREELERRILGRDLPAIWEDTQAFWARRDRAELEKAHRSPKHKMALCFRWYLGLASRWAIEGEASRRMDYQIWCGPAMGAFNDWVKGSFLEPPEARGVVQIARNLLEGAASVTRAHQLRSYGVPVPYAAFHFAPRPLA